MEFTFTGGDFAFIRWVGRLARTAKGCSGICFFCTRCLYGFFYDQNAVVRCSQIVTTVVKLRCSTDDVQMAELASVAVCHRNRPSSFIERDGSSWFL